jgi:hypothetical protein
LFCRTGDPAEATTMSVDERIKPDLRVVPDTCGIWQVQGCTDRGLAWLADEASGQPDQTVVVLDEYVAELADKARDAGLIVILYDGPPLQAG